MYIILVPTKFYASQWVNFWDVNIGLKWYTFGLPIIYLIAIIQLCQIFTLVSSLPKYN